MNFINTINVIDEDTNKKYPSAASYINTNINTGTENNCSQTSIGKIRINYQNTSRTEVISWEQIDDTHKKTEFVLYLENPIISIDFISNDTTITYLTIDTTSLEVGKSYNITQYLRIE